MIKPYLANSIITRDILNRYDKKAQKKFGQNFLIEEQVLENIISGSKITKDDYTFEIGPGIGTLTQYLAYNSKKVIAVEIDKSLKPILEETLKGFDNVVVVFGDVLKIDLERVFTLYESDFDKKFIDYEEISDKKQCTSIKVRACANLPYYITSPIIMRLLEESENIVSITSMVQKEVAERIIAKEGTKDYGILTVASNIYSKPNILFDVDSNSFMPKPNVTSSVLCFEKYQQDPFEIEDKKLFFNIVKGSFALRRKTLVNSLGNFGLQGIGKEEVLRALENIGKDVKVRGETFSLEDFVKLYNQFYEKQI